MKMTAFSFLLIIASATFGTACHEPGNGKAPSPADSLLAAQELKLQLITDQIGSPVAMAVPGDGSGRLFVCQKEGRIWIIRNNKVLPQPFLDVSSKMVSVNPGYDERGLLGLAFSPDFKNNGKFYIYYSAPATTPGNNNRGVVAEYHVAARDPDKADPNSERILLAVEEPESNHNGGELQFGPDGYLYIGLGDGGGAGDKHGATGNGQNLDTWLGKILRIDVNGTPYKVPADNPFTGRQQVKPEIWAYGLRNPWRFSFDKATGRLFAGDVGQNKYEEVDLIEKGGNYGWRIREGRHVYNSAPGSDTLQFREPIDEYDHEHTGISVIGGYVYHGKFIPALKGNYVFGDYNGSVFVLREQNGRWQRSGLPLMGKPSGGFQIFSFGQDAQGELYILGATSESNGQHGKIFKIVPR